MCGFYALEYSLIISRNSQAMWAMTPSIALPQLLDDGETVCCYGGWQRINRKIPLRKLMAGNAIE
jgi:hypothetical protein